MPAHLWILRSRAVYLGGLMQHFQYKFRVAVDDHQIRALRD